MSSQQDKDTTETNTQKDINFKANFLDLSKFKKKEFLHNWKYGSVYKVIDKDNIEMNAKISKKMITEYSQEDLAYLTQDLNISSQFNHPSIMKIYGYSPTNFNNIPTPVIITEQSRGNLLQFFEENLSNTQKLIIMHGIAFGMSYIHSQYIIHRDLTPSNIFVDEFYYPKISNFGLSKKVLEIDSIDDQSQLLSELIGTPLYSSPESLKELKYTKSSDVYSYSLIIYELLMNEKPFKEVKNLASFYPMIVTKNERPKFDEKVPNCYHSLIEKCWSNNPEERPNFDQIVQTLETDPEFVTNDVNKDEYLSYLEKVKSYKSSYSTDLKFVNSDVFFSFKRKESSELTFTNYINIQINVDKQVELLNFEINDKIGTGSASTIYNITEKETGNFYAAKIFTNEIDSKSIEYINKLISEVNILSYLDHPSIIKYIGFSPTNFEKEPYPVLITETCPNGSLAEIIILSKNSLKPHSWNSTKILINMYGIASGMAYLHSHNIIHRDLAPGNILVDKNYYPKICDFGVSKFYDLNDEDLIEKVSDGFVATPNYIDPDISNGSNYSPSCDVYSYGLLVYSIIANKIPFEGLSYHQMITDASLGTRPQLDGEIPNVYKNLIQRCWSPDISKRPKFTEIVEELKTNKEFITEDIDENAFLDYIEYIENYNVTFYNNRPVIRINKDYNYEDEDNDDDLEVDDTPNDRVLEKQKEYGKFTSLKTQTCYLKLFEKKGKIGEGQFGTVFKVLDKESKFIYAAKIAKKVYNYELPKDIVNLEREVKIISQLNHPTVLRFIAYSPVNFNQVSKPTIITEFVSGGSLSDAIESERLSQSIDGWDNTKKLINIYGIASSLSYLHSLGILHRDLKPENILLDKYLCPKLADFGLSKYLNEVKSDNTIQSGCKGTPIFMSPEIWSNQEYSKASDVYAFAYVIYEIMTNEIPFKSVIQIKLMMNVSNGIRPKFFVPIPECYQCLIEECWKQDPDERPTFEEIVDLLKNDSDFISELVESGEFLDYVESIEEPGKETKRSFQKAFVRTKKKERKKTFVHQENFLDLSNYAYEKEEGSVAGSVISKGDFSKIIKIVDKKTNIVYAAKISSIELDDLPESDSINLSREVNILTKLNHPSILKFIGYSPFNFKKEPKPVIVTEYISFGTLEKVLSKKKSAKVDWNNTKKLINIYGIAHSMMYLHSNQILHRDLKPSNILLDENLYPKLTDFGFSIKKHKEDSMSHQSSFAIHNISTFSAPEVLNSEEFTKESDVYSFGMIVFQIMTNEAPFKNLKNDNQLFNEVCMKGNRPKFSKTIPLCYIALIEDCWAQEKDERPNFEQIVQRLENDENFTNEDIDVNEYRNYIKGINDFNITYSGNARLLEPEDFENEDNDSDDSDELEDEDENKQIINNQKANADIKSKDVKDINNDGEEAKFAITEENENKKINDEKSVKINEEENANIIGDFEVVNSKINEQIDENKFTDAIEADPKLSNKADDGTEDMKITENNEEENIKDTKQIEEAKFTEYIEIERNKADNETEDMKTTENNEEENIKDTKQIEETKFSEEIKIESNKADGEDQIVETNEITEPSQDQDEEIHEMDQSIKTDTDIQSIHRPSLFHADCRQSEISIQTRSISIEADQTDCPQGIPIKDIVAEYLADNRAKDLAHYLDERRDYETVSAAFDECYQKSPIFYKELCEEGVLLDNPVAHHKYALLLIFGRGEGGNGTNEARFKEAKTHLEKAAEKGFSLSYFTLARLLYERYNKENSAFAAAREGSRKGDRFSKCLLGSFIAHGIGAKKDRQKGVEMMLESGAEEVYQTFSTDIGLYYIDRGKKTDGNDREENFLNAFKWFEKAYNLKKTEATINNYGLCFLKGVHVEKNLVKARSIFQDGADNGDPNSMYHLAYILEDIDIKASIQLYKEAASKGHNYAQFRYSSLFNNPVNIKSDQISSEFIE